MELFTELLTVKLFTIGTTVNILNQARNLLNLRVDPQQKFSQSPGLQPMKIYTRVNGAVRFTTQRE
jgi:hypothetical protein